MQLCCPLSVIKFKEDNINRHIEHLCHETVSCHDANFDFWNNLLFKITNIEWQNEAASESDFSTWPLYVTTTCFPQGVFESKLILKAGIAEKILRPITGCFVYKADGNA